MPRLKHAALALVLAAFAAGHLARLGVPSEREYDEGVYLLSARSVAAGHELFSEVFSSQPPAFLEALALAFRVAGDSLETGRLLVLALALAALAALGGLGRRTLAALGDDEAAAAPLVAASVAGSLALVGTWRDLAHFVQAETPSLALALLALVLLEDARLHFWPRARLVAAGGLLGLAALFKLFVAPMALAAAWMLALAPGPGPWRRGDFAGFVGRAALVGAGGVAVLAAGLLPYDRDALVEQVFLFHLAKREAYRMDAADHGLRVLRSLANHWGLVVAAAASGVALLRRSGTVAGWLTIWGLATGAAVLAQTPLFWRHLVLAWPPLALLAGIAPWTVRSRVLRAALAALVIAWAATTLPDRVAQNAAPAWPPGSTDDRTPLAAAVAWLREHTSPGDLVLSDDPIVVYEAGREAPPAYCDTSQARILSGWLTLDQVRAAAPGVRVIMLRPNGRLAHLKGFRAWLAEEWKREPLSKTPIGSSREIWLPKSQSAADY